MPPVLPEIPTTRRRFVALGGTLSLILGLSACSDQPKSETPPSTPQQAANRAVESPGLPMGDKALGQADAPVTIVEYASLTCVHCANFHANTFPTLKEKYIDSGKVRLIFREFPLDPLATAAAMVARCAPENRYFPLVSVLFQQQRNWVGSDKPLEELLAIARQAGFSQESFDACLKNQAVYDGLNEMKKRGAEVFGVNSTPTFFINGVIQRGDVPIDEMEKLIAPHLGK